MSFDLQRRLLDDGAPHTSNADAQRREKAAQHVRNVGGPFRGKEFNAAPSRKGADHVLAGDPRTALMGDTTAPAAAERQAKLDAMLPAVCDKAGVLSMQQLMALDVIARASKAADGDPVSALVGDVARALRADHGTAEAVLGELVSAGALRRVQGLWGAPRLLPTL